MSTTPAPILVIREIQIRTHAHATESLPKVKDCFKLLCPFELDEKAINFENLSGIYGNPIRALTLNLSIKEEIRNVVENLGKMLTSYDKIFLKEEFGRHLDDRHRFYFRLSKQALAMGKFNLAQDTDVFRIVISIRNKNPKRKLSLEDILDYLISVKFLE